MADETEAMLKAYPVQVKAYACDVADFQATQELVKTVVADFGSLDILVNNAGITRDTLVMRMSEQDFDDVIDTNLKGAFNLIRHASIIMLKQRAGRIVNITSVAGLMGNPGQANYSAAKAGMVGLTKTNCQRACVAGHYLQRRGPRLYPDGYDRRHAPRRFCKKRLNTSRSSGWVRHRMSQAWLLSSARRKRIHHRSGDSGGRRLRM